MVSHVLFRADRDLRSILDSIRRIVQTLRTSDRQAQKCVGLSGAQLFVLQKLRLGRAVSVNELAERTHTDQSSVSVVTQKLVARKLVRRSQSKADGRAVDLVLTQRGRKLLRGAPAAAQDRLVVALQQLPLQRRRQLRVLLEELASKTGDGDRAPALFFEDAPRSHREECS